MSQFETIQQSLKAKGYRTSKTRTALIKALFEAKTPLSAPSIKQLLAETGISADKTTVYRELTMLKNEGHVRELQLGENIKQYELISADHHHHLVCLDCQKIEDVVLERDLDTEEQLISQTKNFKVMSHSLEFYGICQSCSTIHT